jgi:hypothetical protein
MSGGTRVEFWSVILGLSAAIAWSAFQAFGAWRKNRLVEDTPTSKVRSAAQGYVEFTGRGLLPPDTTNKAPLSGIPCTWWRYKIEELRSGGRSRVWTTIDGGTSETPFILDDGTGTCLVDPRGAEVYASANDVWYGDSEWPAVCIPNGSGVTGWLAARLSGGRYRYTEHRLQAREELYAIGGFSNAGAVAPDDSDRAATALLRSWKGDQKSLLERFDTNHDGVLGADEWDRARDAARKQVACRTGSEAMTPGLSVLSKPADGRAFLLAATDEESLARRLRRRAVAGLAVFVGSSVALTWVLTHVW